MSEPDILELPKPSADDAPIRTVTLALTDGPFTGDRASALNSGPDPVAFVITYNGAVRMTTTIPAGGAVDLTATMEGLRWDI